VLSSQPSRDPANDYEYANRVLFGLARAKSLETGADLVALAVWDGKPGDGRGGSASAVARWRAAEIPTEVVDLNKLARSRGIAVAANGKTPAEDDAAVHDATAAAATAPGAAASPRSDVADAASRSGGADDRPNIAAMLFADAKGFSDLPDDAMEAFVRDYLQLVAEVVDEAPERRPAIVNTWGDGLYMVFDRERDAGAVALRLCERLEEAKAQRRLTLDIRLRVALHAGPVLRCHNAVTNRPDVVGVHVNRAARLEPSTPAGHVYATEPFVALAYADRVTDFRCDYVGPTELAKGYGTEPAYHVRRVRPTGR
jgi:class 3 adenylate cyclase